MTATPRPRRLRLPPSARVPLLTAAVTAMAVGFWLAIPSAGPDAPFRLTLPMLVAGFLASELLVVHFEFRGEAHTFTLSELPLVAGLVFASPPDVLLGGGLATVIVLVAVNRQGVSKAAFNLAAFGLQVAAAVLTYRLVLGGASPLTPAGWLAAFAAVVAADFASHAAVLAVIRTVEGRLQRDALRSVLQAGGLIVVFNGVLALITVQLLWSDVRAAWMLGAAAVLAAIGYRSYAAFRRRYVRLRLLYHYTRVLTEARGDAGGAGASELALAEAASLLNAREAELAMLDGDGDRVWRQRLGADGCGDAYLDDVDALVEAVLASGSARRLDPKHDADSAALLAGRGWRDALVAPVRAGTAVTGVFLVGDRRGDVGAFDDEDLRLFEAFANHAGIALRNENLVVRLREEAEAKAYQASHDNLTGLANRGLFTARLGEMVGDAAEGSVTAVVAIGLSGLGDVISTLGHELGDTILGRAADRLEELAGGRDRVARVDTFEFAVALPAMGSTLEVLTAALGVHQAMSTPVEAGELSLELQPAIGVAVSPEHGRDPAILLRHAHVARTRAGRLRTGVELFTFDHDRENARRLTLVSDLRRAIRTGDLALYYQPLADLRTGRVVGVEALARWAHPRFGFVPPDEFIPAAEQTGLIRPLTSWVLRTALQQLSEWRAQGLDLTVAVNLSARSLTDPGLADEIATELARAGVPPAALTLEITESSLVADVGAIAAVLAGLDTVGVKLAIDDFGTGYSSLAQLKRLPVDEIKIDKAFVMNLVGDADDAAIVRSIVDLAGHFGLEVIAEGIEDQATLDRLVTLGCPRGQGYFLGKPAPAGRLAELLAASATLAVSSRP